jgi:hypothetical protein
MIPSRRSTHLAAGRHPSQQNDPGIPDDPAIPTSMYSSGSGAKKMLDTSAHVLDVLPRHRLLPQPGGFEGLFARAVLNPSHDVAVADLHDDREVLQRHRHAAQL